jgi:hypothetical protein
MSVNHEVKGNLARLLATEDLVVEHKNVSTASFNVDTRVLVLPMWEKASNVVYDMLVGHEVGHALYTPNEDLPQHIPHQFVNVVEDARIEKLMKRRYAGLNKCFYGGYQQLHDDDFFQVKDEDISTFNLADRVNLYFKVGNYLEISFTEREMEIVRLVDSCETFADVIIAAEELYKYCKTQEQEQVKIGSMDNHESNAGGSDPGESADQSMEQDSPETSGEGGQSSSEGQSDEQTDKPSDSGSNQGGETHDPEVRTADNLEESIRDLVSNSSFENIYVELPKVNLETAIASNSDVHAEIDRWWKLTEDKISDSYENAHEVLFGEVDKEYVQFKRSAQKEVNYLVKEFECKKAADSYARATTARTGVLDCTKLHSYKYNEDLFRKVTTLSDGKNHGLVFVLDWSGSMSRVMQDTVKQLYNLMWFCKKVAIPFEVYAFTHEWRRNGYDENGKFIPMKPHYTKKHGLAMVDESFCLMNLFTSKTNNRVLEEQMINIWRIAYEFSANYNKSPMYQHPSRLALSGTPLNEALVTLHQILPKFQKENNLQKVQCVVLTDGEAAPLKYHKEFKGRLSYDTEEVYIGLNRIDGYNSFLRDRKTGNTYKFGHEYHEFSDVLLRNLRDRFPEVNFIGMRVLESRDAGSFVRRYYETSDYSSGYYQENKEYQKVMNDWKKTKSFSIKKSGYHTYFGLSSAALSQDSEFEVSEDASKSQIKSAFAKSLKGKKMNKKILGEFIELVA